ncbi:protein of unknown function DUF477 [Solidesulfovibrio fructosivorans JJ]]|uniref:TPM domain-containing protein n=1 Tax=Solidesulfovibrio fructosivorans JJ] TaxID=596151 RepID=E1JUE8_SOLFR|nr:hypothetical protein [Solidesulfovibrio fructosivorans]EFL52078.1 protein of unknown function DUF477 [Solidesulfovibrio fructosivorans JJ]]
MRHLVNAFLSADDRKKVVAAVRAAETTTSAEIVPMVVGASDSYPKAELACGLAVGLVGGVLCALVFGTRGMWLFLLYFGLFALAGFHLAKRLPSLKRLFVSKPRARHETLVAAQAAFYAQGLCATQERNALLIYISVFERLVFVLPDSGLAGRIDSQTLEAGAAALSAGIRQGRPREALTAVIGDLAKALAALYPPRPGDANTLKDLILL